MPKIYRSMKRDGDKPLVENSANGLGVRVGNGPNDDLPVTNTGEVVPGSGGMSVSSSWRFLPIHRIPRRLRVKLPSATGNNSLSCWSMGTGEFSAGAVGGGLVLRADSTSHGLVEPAERTHLDSYLKNLTATRDEWVIDED